MVNNCRSRPIEILLVEDSLSDTKLITKAFEQISTAHHLRVVPDGIAATNYLLKQDRYHIVPRPDLILLDLHLPRKDGLTVLQEIKSDPELANIPVIMLTASEDRQSIAECYQKEANCYLIKPSSFPEFKQMVAKIQDFWLQVVQFPSI